MTTYYWGEIYLKGSIYESVWQKDAFKKDNEKNETWFWIETKSIKANFWIKKTQNQFEEQSETWIMMQFKTKVRLKATYGSKLHYIIQVSFYSSYWFRVSLVKKFALMLFVSI